MLSLLRAQPGWAAFTCQSRQAPERDTFSSRNLLAEVAVDVMSLTMRWFAAQFHETADSVW
jgi:hypothetical protein